MKGIIFDLDGVLIFTDIYHYQAWKKLADELGLAFDEAKNHRLRGISRMESLDIVLEEVPDKYSPAEKQRFSEAKNDTYRKLLEAMSPEDVSEEVRSTLAELKRRGYLLAIGSSSKNAGFILDKTDLRKYFDAVSDGNNITRSKPDPEVFQKAAEYLKLSAADCCVVEDAEAGIDAAKAAGMHAVGIGEASRYAQTDSPIDDFTQLLQVVK